MPNWCFSEVCVYGSHKGISKLFSIMKGLQDMSSPLIENDFGTTWYGNLVHKLGKSYRDIDCRGYWMDLRMDKSVIKWADMAAWEPVYDVFKLIENTMPSLKVYYSAEEEGCNIFVTNDVEGKFFSARYILSTEKDREYFEDAELLLKEASIQSHKNITTIDQLWDIIQELDDWSLNVFDIK